MHKRILTSLTLLMLSVSLSVIAQQDTNAPAATNAPAPPGANNDPAGGATGTVSDSSGSAGAYTYNVQVSAPAELSADDKKDAAKVAKYNDDKKAFDEYTG